MIKEEFDLKKVLIGIMILISLMQAFCPFALALEMSEADIVFTGRTAPPDLLYTRLDGEYGSIVCSIVGYNRDGKFYPVYCLDGGLPGAETEEYGVNISNYITDIHDVVNNEKVWRVVTNGYPYNNMGLSDDDAYMVTKIAIYCVTGNADFSRYTYDESRPVTVQTYNALKNLVEVVAENTSIKRQTGTITISETRELTELNDYYFQEFLASSKLEETSYEVANLEDFPEGTFVANLENNPQTVFNPGEKFRILIPKSGMIKDIDGKFDVIGKVKNYPVFYGKAPDGYQNYAVTFDSFGDEIAKGSLKISCIEGWIRIIKQDLENNSVRLEGTKFELYDENMNLLETLETDEKGEAISGKYPTFSGKYYLKEIQATEGYVMDEELHEIQLAQNGILDVFIKNAKEPKEPEIIVIEKEVEPEIIVVEKEPEVIIKEIEPDPIYKEVIIGEPNIIEQPVKLTKTGM